MCQVYDLTRFPAKIAIFSHRKVSEFKYSAKAEFIINKFLRRLNFFVCNSFLYNIIIQVILSNELFASNFIILFAEKIFLLIKCDSRGQLNGRVLITLFFAYETMKIRMNIKSGILIEISRCLGPSEEYLTITCKCISPINAMQFSIRRTNNPAKHLVNQCLQIIQQCNSTFEKFECEPMQSLHYSSNYTIP